MKADKVGEREGPMTQRTAAALRPHLYECKVFQIGLDDNITDYTSHELKVKGETGETGK